METLGAIIVIVLCMILGSFVTIIYQDRHIWKQDYLDNLEDRVDAHVNEQPWK